VALTLFKQINTFRAGPQAFITSTTPNYVYNILKGNDYKCGGSLCASFTQFSWSEALSNAAKHVINYEEPCGTYGDQNGNSVEEVLARYYSYSFENLRVIKVRSPLLNSNTTAVKVLEYMIY